MRIIFRNTKLSFTKHWGAKESASIIQHFRAAAQGNKHGHLDLISKGKQGTLSESQRFSRDL